MTSFHEERTHSQGRGSHKLLVTGIVLAAIVATVVLILVFAGGGGGGGGY